jgi:hypothetical protein
MISTSPDQVTYMRVERGYPLAVKLVFTKSDNSPIDLTNHFLLFYLRQPQHKGGEAIDTEAEITLDEPNTRGRALLYIQGDPLDLDAGEYPFAISVTPNGGMSTLVVKGVLEVVENANTVGVPDFTTVTPPSELAIKVTERNRIVIKTNHMPDEILRVLAAAASDSAGDAQESADAAAASAAAAVGTVDLAEAQRLQAEAAASAAEAALTAAEAAAAAAAAQEAAAAAAASAAASSADDADETAEQVALLAAAVAAAEEATAAALLAANNAAAAANAAADAAADAVVAAAAAAAAAAESAAAAAAILTVQHGDDPNVARPLAAIIHWVGLARPVNSIPTDFGTKVTLS